MKILLTGGTGFVGSHVLRQLLLSGHTVSVLRRTTSDVWRIRELEDEINYVYVDKVDYEEFFSADSYDIIIHCATHYGRGDEEFLQNVETNILFPLRLLELAGKYGVKYFINTDSFFTKQIYKKNTPIYMGGYTMSKQFFSQYGRYYASKVGVKFINMRLEHVYGPNDARGKFLPMVIQKCQKGESLDLSEGLQERDFVHVEDVARAYDVVVSNIDNLLDDDYEVGVGRHCTIREFCELIKKATNSSSVFNWGKVPMKQGEIMCSVAHNESLIRMGWKPEVTEELLIIEAIANIICKEEK